MQRCVIALLPRIKLKSEGYMNERMYVCMYIKAAMYIATINYKPASILMSNSAISLSTIYSQRAGEEKYK